MSYQEQPSLDAVVLRNVLLRATRALFAKPENYGDLADKLQAFKWDPNDEKGSSLQIELDWNFDPHKIGNRQSIFVGIDDIDFHTDFIDHRSDISEDRSRITYTQSATTKAQIRAVSPLPDEPLYLTTVASAYFLAMRPQIMNHFNLTRYDMARLSKTTLVKNTGEALKLYESMLSINLAFNFSIVSSLEGVRIKAFTLDLNSQ